MGRENRSPDDAWANTRFAARSGWAKNGVAEARRTLPWANTDAAYKVRRYEWTATCRFFWPPQPQSQMGLESARMPPWVSWTWARTQEVLGGRASNGKVIVSSSVARARA